MATSRKMLWHYTDTAGFHGVVRSNRVRLGDSRFLNDRTERQYGISLVTQAIVEELRKGKDHFLAVTAHYLASRETHAVHVCSFSEVPNSISQWQRYGADGHGYCLGFSAAALRRIQTSEIKLKRVVYNPSRQRQLVRTRLETLREAFRIAERDRDESMSLGILLGVSATIAAIVFESLALELKDASFSDEREWRLIHQAPGSAKLNNIEFAPRGDFVKPFVEIELPRGPKRRSPLTAVVCGPRLDGSLAVATASYFLRAASYAIEASWSELHKVWR